VYSIFIELFLGFIKYPYLQVFNTKNNFFKKNCNYCLVIWTLFYKVKEFTRVKLASLVGISNTIKLIFPKFYNITTVMFFRKNRTFIKSKYSRTRQWSKVIVYFGLWYGVLSIWFMMLHTYKFIFILSYIWWVPALICLMYLLRYFKKNWFFMRFTNLIYYWFELEYGYWEWIKTK
jgi:hypothetical protein